MHNRLGAMVQAAKKSASDTRHLLRVTERRAEGAVQHYGAAERGGRKWRQTGMIRRLRRPPRHQSRRASDRTSHAHYLWLALA